MRHTSTTVAKHISRLPTMTPDRWTAIVIWLIGVYTTRQALLEVGLAQTAALIAGLALQWILTRVERRVWLGKIGVAPVIALILDTLFNAAGIFPYAQKFGGTAAWAMLQAVAQTQEAFSVLAALGMALGLGYAIARLPEQLWSDQ